MWLGGLIVVLALSLGACGGGGEEEKETGGGETTETTAPEGVTLDVSAKEFAYTPPTFTVPADTVVTVNFTNDGTVEHNLKIDEAGLAIVAQPGQTATGTFSLPAGTYKVYCTVPGHEQAGMVGSITAS